MQKALINEDGAVLNVIEYSDRSGLCGQFPEGCALIECTGLPVCVGDFFDAESGRFLRDGVGIERVPGAEERLEQLEGSVAALTSALRKLKIDI